jgi:hypothetical protein
VRSSQPLNYLFIVLVCLFADSLVLLFGRHKIQKLLDDCNIFDASGYLILFISLYISTACLLIIDVLYKLCILLLGDLTLKATAAPATASSAQLPPLQWRAPAPARSSSPFPNPRRRRSPSLASTTPHPPSPSPSPPAPAPSPPPPALHLLPLRTAWGRRRQRGATCTWGGSWRPRPPPARGRAQAGAFDRLENTNLLYPCARHSERPPRRGGAGGRPRGFWPRLETAAGLRTRG